MLQKVLSLGMLIHLLTFTRKRIPSSLKLEIHGVVFSGREIMEINRANGTNH